MPFNPLRNEIDKIHLQNTGKTSEQIHSDLLKVDQEIANINAISGPSINVQKESESLQGNVKSLLEGNILKNFSTLTQAGSKFGIEFPKLELDEETNKNIDNASKALTRSLREGSLDESQKALAELKTRYNDAADSSMGSAQKEKLRKSYADIVDRVNQTNTIKISQDNLDGYYNEIPLEQREAALQSFNPNQRLSLALKPSQTTNADIINKLADFESNRVGSRIYNTEDLNVFKSTYVKTDDDLYAGMEMQYNYAMKNAVDQKIASYQEQIATLDQQIKASVDPRAKEAFAFQKANLKKELDYSNKLSQKLTPYTSEDTYLKNFYPEQYTRKKEREKQEVYRNEMLAEGDKGSLGETLYRAGQQTKSNFLKQVAGLSYLGGAEELGYRIKSGADYAAPPTFFVGKDLNKNNKIDDSEITRDIHGNKVTMSQVSWTDKNGNTTWNLWAPVEQVLPIATDVAMTIALSKGVGAIGRGVGLGYGRLAATAGLSEANTASFLKNVAPRISTLGTVTATTFPRFYAEERANFKDGDTAFKVATMRAVVEGLTETIIPDTELFSGKIAYGALDPVFSKLGKLDPTALGQLTIKRDALLGLLPKGALSAKDAALLMAPASVRRTLSGAAQESIEELGSLVGNYFVDKYASSQNFEVEETNKITTESFLDTLVEGFIPSLFISGGSNLFSRGALRQERLNQARWNIANNPEKYKQVIANQVQQGKLTKEEGLKRTAAVDNLGRRLESMTEINHIKSLTNLLDDKEAQYNYFTSLLKKEDFLLVDTTQLSEDQLKEYQTSLDKVDKDIINTKSLTDKYAGLEESDKREIISKLFNSQAKAAESTDTSIESLLGIAAQTRQSLLSLPVSDPRYEFVAAEYKKFQDRVDSSLSTRIQNFTQVLENNPEQLTSLELAVALNTYLPAIERLNTTTAETPSIPTPLAENLQPLPQNAPELIQAVRDELLTREVLNEEDFLREVNRNLQNPETKSIQGYQIAIAELSPEELTSGKLNEEEHSHLSAAQRLILATRLEDHVEEKKANPEQPTSLEEKRDRVLNELYNNLIGEQDEQTKRNSIIDLNKRAIESAPEAPVVNNFSPQAQEAPTPSQKPIPGKVLDVDQDVFDEYALLLSDLNELVSNPDADIDEVKGQVSELIKGALRNLDNLENLNQVRSALLGLYPDDAQSIEDTFAKASEGIVDVSGLTFVTGKRKEFVQGVIAKLVSQNQVSQTATPADVVSVPATEEVIEEAPELISDSVVESDNYESAQETKAKEDKEFTIKGERGLHIVTITTNRDNQTIQDPAALLIDNIVTVYSEDTRSNKTTDLNLRIQSVMGIYEFIFDAPKVERLKAFKEKSSLTEEEKTELVSLLTVNGVPIHNQPFMNHVKENPSKIGSGISSVFVNSNGDLVRFTKLGKPSKAKTSLISVPVLPNKNVSPEMASVRKQATEGKIIVSSINGVVSGYGWGAQDARPLAKAVGEKIYVHTDPISRTLTGAQKNYVLNPGSVHIVKDGARNPYTGVSIPTNGNTVQALVNAFNDGTLPQTLSESIRTDAATFLDYMSQQVNSTFVKTTEGGAKSGMRFFKKANLYLTATSGNRIVVEYPVEGKDKKKYIKPSKNQQEDLLKIGESSYKLVSARLVEQNAPYTALVVKESGEVVTKNHNTYSDFVKSPEFGATFVREENRTLSFSPDYRVIDPNVSDVVDATNDNLPVQPAATQPIDAKADIERRRQEELSKGINEFKQAKNKEELTNAVKDWIGKDPYDTGFVFLNVRAALTSPGGFEKGKEMLYENHIKPLEKLYNDKINAKYDAELAALEQPVAPTTSKIDRLRSKLNNLNTGEDRVEFNRNKTLRNNITKKQNEAAKNWVANHPIFKNTPFIFDNTINHPEAYAVWSKAGIFLFEGANYAEAYHEAWHEFSQLYLTPEQKAALYAEARSIYGDLSFVELEEKLAEDFRAYALSEGKVLPASIAEAKESKSIFKQIWDFISNLFSDKKTVDHYFSRLYKGNLTQFKRKEANQYFIQLFSGKYVYEDEAGNITSLSYKDSKAFLDDLDSIYVYLANNMFASQNATLINVLSSPVAANKTYSYLAKSLLDDHDSLVEQYNKNNDESLLPTIENLRKILEDFDNVAQFHKTNSSLFSDNIRKQLVSEQIVSIEQANVEFATFEASVNEMSQKQIASQTLINALKTLPRYENGEIVLHPVYSVPKLSDFNTNWNILQRRLSGSNSYQDLYSRLQGVVEEYPQFQQFISYLPSPTESIDKGSSLNFKNEFYKIFSMPYIEGYTTDIKRNEEGEIVEAKVFQAQSLDAINLRNKFDTDFSLSPSAYSNRNNTTGTFYLDTDKYFATFPGVPTAPKDEEEFAEYNLSLLEMLKPLGFNLSPNAEELFVKENAEIQERVVNLIYNKLKSLSQTQAYIMEPLSDLSSDHVNAEGVKVAGESGNVSSVIQYEVEANPQYVNDMRYNAVNKQIWSINQHTFMSKTLNVLNDGKLYPTLDEVYAELPHLNPQNNPNAKSSFVLSYLFNESGKRRTDKYQGIEVPRKVELGNLLGIKDIEGEKTIDSNEAQKHYSDIIGLTKAGIEEINRLSGKSTTRGLVFDRKLRNYLGLLPANNQADPFILSGANQVPYDLFVSRIVPLIEAEVQVTAKGSDKFKIDAYDTDGSPKLTYFHKIFTPEQRIALFSAFKSPASNMSLQDVFESINGNRDIYTRFGQYINSQANKSKIILGVAYNLPDSELMKYHFFSAVGRIEQHKIFFGHPYYYKNPKDIEKRLSAWNAFGSYATIDPQNMEYLESGQSGLSVNSGRDALHNYAQQNNIKVNPNRANIDQISYIVLKDEAVKSATASKSKSYGESKDAYTSDKSSAKQDAAAFCTIDFFRKFYSISTGVTPEMMEEFKRQDDIYKKYLELQTAPDYAEDTIREELEALLNKKATYNFTIKKLQYSGHNKIESGESVPVFHKYSMKPILPSEMVDNPELASILQKLHASSADYAVFTSGTKISETVAPVSLFDSKGKVKSQAVPTGVVDLKYLKEQVLIENKEDFNSIFSTQFRKLVYKDATTESELAAYQEYKSIIENLTNFDKLNFVEQLQDKEKLVEFLIKEISKKNAAESTKDLLQLKTDNTLMYTLDSMIDRTIMESAIVASVKNQIIRQKVPGAQRVQYPVSLIRPNRKLAYYDVKSSADGSTIRKAETIVSFSKGYYPLLNLLSPIDNQPIGELNANGTPVNPYTALTRLNEALKDVQFRNTYASQMSMVAIRIPGQGYNSMENFEVVEFLPEESGEIILVPDEMVIKSGSDYDIDKLFCYDPSINNDGSMLVDRVSTPEDLIVRKKELLADLKETRELKRQYTEEKKELLDELGNILTTNGFDASSRLRSLYQELKSLKGVSEGELMDAGVTEGDLETLRKKFSGELVPEKQQKSAETINKIRRIKNVLRTASEKELSSSLADLSEWIGDLVKDEKSLLQDLKNLRNGYTNALLLNISNRLSQPEIFEALITPNTIETIDKAVKEFGTSSDSTTASLTNLINPIYQLYVFSLNTYKTALGTDAKNNVFHSLLQKTTFYREDEQGVRRYLLESNRTADGYIDFSRVNNVDGTRISRMSGETISAHVDIEKNDGIALIGLNNLITPVVNYVLMAGTRFNDIVNLINKPTVIDGKKFRSSILDYSKGKSLEDILETILERVPEDSLAATLINNSRNKYGAISRSKFIFNVYKQMYAKTTQETARGELLSREEPLFDVRRLAVFLELEDQTRDLATISLAVDYDTFSPQNFESFRSASLELIPYLKEGGEKSAIFNRQGLLDVIGNTVVSPFQVQQDVLDKFVEVFPISANPKITNKILKQFAIAKETNRRLDYDRYSRVFKNDLLYALFLNNVPQAGMFEQFLDKRNPGNIGSLYTNLKARLAQRGITAENDIFGLVAINSDINSTFIRTGLKQTELEFSVDIYKEEFEKGFNWSHPSLDPTNASDAELIADMQGFFKAFAYAGILGTQLNKKFDSYLPLIPESIYTFPMSSVIPEFISRNEAALEEDNSKFMNDFTTRFRENHPELYGSKNIPVTLNYYKDYNLSRDNMIDLTTISQSELTLKYSESAQASTNLTPKGTEVKGGIYVNQSALSQEEQLELFNYLKPFLEEQAAKTNKGKSASKMIGLGLRWDYKSNNPGKKSVSIPDVINPLNKTKYGYYTTSINDQPLAPITSRFRELMQKASGVDMTNYDGAIINLYEENTFISSHNDVDESRSAINYPVIGVNLGGTGNFSIESRDGSPKQLDLKSGTAYVFGVNGVNREVFHRTLPKPQDSFLPELTTRLDGKTYEPGSYRVTITMRRVMPLVEGMTINPLDVVTQITNVPKQSTINFEEENQLFLDESFAKLREINNNLSKNC